MTLARWRTKAALLLLQALLAGCASSRAMAPAPSRKLPSSPAEGRAELAELEQQIEASRAALGLPPRPAGARPPAEPSPAAEKEAANEAAAAQDSAARAPSYSTESAGASGDGCGQGPCRFTRAICEAASRICDIARYLGDQEAQGRCSRAQQDCAEARRSTRQSCPGC